MQTSGCVAGVGHVTRKKGEKTMKDETEFTQAGFDAIAHAMQRFYPGQEGLYYGAAIPYFLGGSDPLEGVEVWKSEKGMPHWHYVT